MFKNACNKKLENTLKIYRKRVVMGLCLLFKVMDVSTRIRLLGIETQLCLPVLLSEFQTGVANLGAEEGYADASSGVWIFLR